jgi:ribosomal protein L29
MKVVDMDKEKLNAALAELRKCQADFKELQTKLKAELAQLKAAAAAADTAK